VLEIGLSSGALFPTFPTEQAPDRAAELGLTSVELLLQTVGEYDAGFLQSTAAAARDAGVRIHALHTFQPLHPLFSPYPRRTEEALELMRRAVDGAVTCGAEAIVWHGASRNETRDGDIWPRFLDRTGQIAKICAEAGIRLALENVSWCVLSSVRETLRFRGHFDELPASDAIGFAFDPFQAHEASANPFMLLAAMEGRIVDVHLSDGREHDPTARHLLPGEGDLPWPALIRAVAACGYAGPMMIEAPLPDRAAVDRVRALLDPLIAATDPSADPCAAPLPVGVKAGIDLFNRGEFYEAHEVIEHEWHAERRPIRRLYQGILQIGVGFHHARGGNHRGAGLLLTDGIAKVSEFLPACGGVDTARLAGESQACLDEIIGLGPDRLAEFDWSRVPTISVMEPKRT
jgi:uncharacterized protein